MKPDTRVRNDVRSELDANHLSASAASELTGIPYRSMLRSLDRDANPPLAYAVLLGALVNKSVEELYAFSGHESPVT
jgi:hypothetical protein